MYHIMQEYHVVWKAVSDRRGHAIFSLVSKPTDVILQQALEMLVRITQ